MVVDAEYEKKVGLFTKTISKMAKMWIKKETFSKKNSLNGRKKSPKTAKNGQNTVITRFQKCPKRCGHGIGCRI